MVSLALLVSRLRAAGETTRLRILKLLSQGELTVSELTQVLAQSQPRVSRHLKLLLDAGLIERHPEGAWVFYRLAEGEGEGGVFLERLMEEVSPEDGTVSADRERRAQVTAVRAEQAARYFAQNAEQWDKIRALYLPEPEVEAAMTDLLGEGPDDLLVDLGTGTGRVLEVLAPQFKRAIGFDVNHAMLGVARVNLERAGLNSVHVRHGDLMALPLAAASAGAVVLHQVLHFLDNPAGAIAAASRLLVPSGQLLIVDFAPHELEFLRSEHAHRRLGFAHEEVARWCRSAGLTVAATRTLAPATADTGDARALTVNLWLARAPKGVGAAAQSGRAA